MPAIDTSTIFPLSEIEGQTPVETLPLADRLIEQEAEEIAPNVEATTDEDFAIGSMNAYLCSLPTPADDIDVKLGFEVKEKMLLDATINSTLHWLVAAATDKDPSFEPLIPEKTDPNFDRSMLVYDFCMRAIEGFYDQLPEFLGDMGIGALAFGNKIGEKVCALQESGPDAGKYYLRDVKPRDYNSYAYVTDPHKNVVALAVRAIDGVDAGGRAVAGAPSKPSKVDLASIGGNAGTGLPQGWKLLPRDKFAILTLRKHNGDPRGSSVLRHIYNEWWLIQSVFPHYLKYLLKFASPSIVVTAPEGGNTIRLPGGKTVSITKSLLRDLKGFENSSATVLPAKSNFQLAQSNGGGEAFLGALSMLEQRIQIGITNQVLASAEGKHMARAAAQTHQDSRNVVVRQIRRMLEVMVRRDIFQYLIRINLGEEFVPFAPVVNLGRVDPEDMGSIMTSVASLKTAGFFRDEQSRGLDSMFGFPRREEPKFADPETSEIGSLPGKDPKPEPKSDPKK